MFSGCLGDKIVGTWNGEKTSATATFDKDGSYVAKLGALEIKGTWEKTDSGYTLYYQDVKVGSAAFEDKILRITLGSGLLNISDTFVKA
ncbi:hypothetical protein MmiEs2_13460 [Methanimicrococcus stummii]|uniref:DUF5640 domain-containing protein n=1 Tax=Methanimicrococcus stummii TaxID=3028294 RepID=A0AA96V9M3_9EURY|nr:hypothetical protein [Methanimicrococcus sp. Es2]WNY29129.1 hypothetical protein MmiEs2_13460 [Methanimicrococcus sp. Es2]